MNKVAILSIAFLVSITIIPNVYAEEGGFFDWLMKLFGGSEEREPTVEIVEDEAPKIKKAVIIDQLYRDIPNKSYQKKCKRVFDASRL